MSKLSNFLLFASGIVGGFYLGASFVNKEIKTEKYEFVVHESDVYLKSIEHNTAHVLTVANNDVFMGSVEHMANGVKNMYINEHIDDLVK